MDSSLSAAISTGTGHSSPLVSRNLSCCCIERGVRVKFQSNKLKQGINADPGLEVELNLDHDRDVKALFRTPLARFALPNAEEINPGLEIAILDRRAKAAGMARSNVRGWHSDRDFQNWPEPEARELVDSMRSAVQNMVSLVALSQRFSARIEIVAWANVNGPGSYNQYHTHPNCLWTGVYYVRAGDYRDDDLKHAGKLKLYDPRPRVDHLAHPGQGFGRNVNITPRNGTMVVFPSWLAHSVNSFDSDTLRISVAFNARVKDFKDLEERGANEPT